MKDAHRMRADELDALGIKHVPCETCSMPTEAGSKAPRCAGCWEVEHRIDGYLRDGGARARDFLVAALGEAARSLPAHVERLEPGVYLAAIPSKFWIAQCHCGPVWPLNEKGRFCDHPRYARPGEPGWKSDSLKHLLTKCEGSGVRVPIESRRIEGSPEAVALIERVYPHTEIKHG